MYGFGSYAIDPPAGPYEHHDRLLALVEGWQDPTSVYHRFSTTEGKAVDFVRGQSDLGWKFIAKGILSQVTTADVDALISPSDVDLLIRFTSAASESGEATAYSFEQAGMYIPAPK